MRVNISLKIIMSLLSITFILFSAMSYISVETYARDVTDSFVTRAEAVAYSIEAGIHNEDDIEERSNLLSLLQKSMWLDPEITDITFYVPRGGVLVGYVSSNSNNLDSMPGEKIIEVYESGEMLQGITDDKGGRKLRITGPLHLSGQVVGAVEMDFTMEEVDKKIADQVLFYAWFYVPVVLAFVLSIFVLLRTFIIKPLHKINEGMEAVSREKLDYAVRIDSDDEMGDLASAFNQMRKDLKQSRDQIKKHSQELEQKVEERTADLNQKVQELSNTKTAVLNMMEDMDEANKELVETQDRLKKTLQKLREMDAKKDQFISIAAHELKTPLTSIHGFSQLLQSEKILKDKTKREKYLKIMDKESKRLGKLVGDILDLSRIDLGTVKLRPEKVDINGMMENIKKEMEMAVKKAGLKSEYEIGEDIPRVRTDREKLTEIVINLINNAVKYTPKGKIYVKVFEEGENVHFMVKDTGMGISRKFQEKIFDRFYQVDSSFTRSAGGTGLGLSLCKEFVKMLGGEIWVVSEPRKGSEFHFTIPLKGSSSKYEKEEERKARKVLKESEDAEKKIKSTGLFSDKG